MIVVSNTSPLTNLAAIGEFGLLQQLYGTVAIAEAVWEELNEGGNRWPGSQEAETASWILRHPNSDNRKLVEVLRRDLDRGEAESIALAGDLNADLLLMDEREGRRAAMRLDLPVIGVLGVLLDAKQNGYIPNIRPLVYSLREEAGFYLSDAVIQRVLTLAHEIS